MAGHQTGAGLPQTGTRESTELGLTSALFIAAALFGIVVFVILLATLE